ncbi:MAG TPA: dienelactone hydrolase family protein, partial [Acidimicrobiales bacterium]|nr:dienelactone hydrolase family protein [Acidimicrobiales bacterium]
LAPDLYHGESASHTEMDKAGRLMASLPPDRAARDMAGAVGFLLDHEAVRGSRAGVVGFCMGGALALLVAAQEGARIGAVVPYYGAPLAERTPDWSGLVAPVLGHVAEKDNFFPPAAMSELETSLKQMGKDVTFHQYPGCGHAFANETNALGTYDVDAARSAWSRTVEFLHEHLG